MRKSHFPDLDIIASEKLHYAFGANCYQHAILAARKVYIHLEPMVAELNSRFINYAALVPGGLSIKFGDSADVVKEGVVRGATIDGLIDCGQELKQRDGYKTVALYFADKGAAGVPDFHFVKRTATGWEDKTPMQDVRHYSDLPAEIDGYTFSRYFLVPDGVKPTGLEKFEAETIIATSPGREDIHFESVTEASFYGRTVATGNRVMLLFNEGFAFLTSAKAILPMPYCPEFIKPKQAFDFSRFDDFVKFKGPLFQKDFKDFDAPKPFFKDGISALKIR